MIYLCIPGKSTLALLLTDDASLVAEKRLGEYRIIQNIEGRSRIGKKTTVSHTTFPEPFVDSNGVVYYDCPGFADSRKKTPHIEIANAMFIKRVGEYAQQLKVLVAVNSFSIGPTADRNDFLETLSHVSNLFNVTAFAGSVGVVITKVNKPGDTDNQITKDIAEFMLDVRDQLPETSSENELEQKQKLIDEFLKQDSDGSFSRIAIFRSPGTAGSLDKQQPIMKNKADIREMVSSLQAVSHKNDDIGFVLSDSARLLTKDVHAQVKTRTEKGNQTVVNTLPSLFCQMFQLIHHF